MSNRLAYEKSPYLLQHKDNPVDWYPWGEEAFQKAKEEGKPILLSIGYSTCHWCHVMGRESFENQEIAAYLNRHFISIKVDREERPDIDAIYMAVCQGLTGDGGWPLTVFLTPERKPFFAGTYFPEETRYGRIGFLQLLRQITGLWYNDRAKLIQAGGQITAALTAVPAGAAKEPGKSMLSSAYRMLERSFDPRWGGFGQAPKFPTPHVLLFLMTYEHLEEDSKRARPMVEKTLSAMSRGGIFDQIGGGFCRYSTDERWLVPHFEKMLYDNALLLLCYACAYQQFGKASYARVARMTADYMLRELRSQAGGFFCGQDADSDGEEGRYYLLSTEEISSVLGEKKGAEFCRLYHISDHVGIPNCLEGPEPEWTLEEPVLAALYAYRKRRVSLHTDDKILLSWNSWAILALSQAGLVLGEKAYLEGALQAQKFIQAHMTVEGKLYRRYRDGEAGIPGQLEDYAVYVLALLGLYRVTWEVSFLGKAIEMGTMFRNLFEDSAHGGFYMNREEDETLIARLKETGDSAIPSGNSVAQLALEVLAGLTGEPEWRKAADRQHRFMAEHVEKSPTGHCFSLLSMMRVLYPTKELVVAANHVPPALVDYLRTHSGSQWSIVLKTPDSARTLSSCAPFTANFPVPEGDEAVYYLCENGVCTKKSENVF